MRTKYYDSSQGADIDIVFIWRRLDSNTLSGRNCLVRLAIRILSVIANSGGCERAFSDFGITHTKLRNKLNAEKVHKTSVVKMDRRQSHSEAGLLRARRKRKFGVDNEPSPTPTSLTPADFDSSHEDSLNFDALADQLIHDAGAQADGAIDSEDEQIEASESIQQTPHSLAVQVTPQPSSTSCRSQRSSKSKGIPLSSLFSFSDPCTHSRLQFYWTTGLRNLERETIVLDLQHDTSAPETESQPVSSQETATSLL